MIYCELCENEYSEVKYLAHLNKCIEEQNLFTKEGVVNKKVPTIFKILQKNFSHEKIIFYLNSAENKDYRFKNESMDSYQHLLLSGGWTPFLYDAAPDLITYAYLHALRSKNNEINTIARNNISSMFSYLTKEIYLSPYEEAKPGILSLLVNILRYTEAQDFLKQKYRAMSVVEKYDIKRWASRVVDEHSPYSELKERMNREKKILASFISRIYSQRPFIWGLTDWNDEEGDIYVNFDIICILANYRQNSFEDIKALVNEFYSDADTEEIWISLDNMERNNIVKAEKYQPFKNSRPRLFYNLTTRGYDLLAQYSKHFDRKPSKQEPKIKSCSKSDFEKFLKGE